MKLLPLLTILPLIAATPAFAGVLMFPKNLTPQKYLSNCQSVNGSASRSGAQALLCEAAKFAVTCTFDNERTICADVENAPARLFFFEEARVRPNLSTGSLTGRGDPGGAGPGGPGGGGGSSGGGFGCIAPCDDGPRPPSDPTAAGSGTETMGLPPAGNGSGIH
jgi:uncharacterized membrane protein YgcG